MALPKDLVAASATPMVLSILSQGDSYGYAIIQRVRELSGGEMQWADGMLYPILHRLQDKGLIEAYWGVSESGRKRKYYRLRDTGLEVLEQQRRDWRQVQTILDDLQGSSPCLG